MIYVNNEKLKRAENIIGLVSGTIVPQTELDVERKARFTALIKAEKVKDEDALNFVYTKLGGLVRSEAEEAAFKNKVRSLVKKNK